MKILSSILRFIFSWLDSILVWLITTINNLLIDISNVILYSSSTFKTLGQRLGIILGVFMLFRLAILLISYLMSPDKLSDGSKGGKKIILNILISLGLLITYNMIFLNAYKVQKVIVDSNIFARVLFGVEKDVKDVNVSYFIYTAFFTPNTSVVDKSCSRFFDLSATSEELKNCDLLDKFGEDTDINAINDAIKFQDMKYIFGNFDVVNARSNDAYIFDYTPIVSTAAGVIAALILLGFCMDIATRSVKLFFLQLIAPIPIISNMDPGKGKDVFSKWYKACLSTYLSLFIRLIAIYFAVFMISLVVSNFADLFVGSPFIKVFIIIGCLMFAKQVPKLIEEISGIKMDGNFKLNPLKKFQDEALFGKNITGLAGAGLAGAAAFGTNIIANKGNIGSGFAGAASATSRGFISAIRGQGFSKSFSSSYSASNRARNNRSDRRDLDVNSLDVYKNSLQRRMGLLTESEKQDAEVKVYDEFVDSAKAAKSRAESEIDKFDSKITVKDKDGSTDTTLGTLKQNIEYMKMHGASATDISLAERLYNDRRTEVTSKYLEAAKNGELNVSQEFTYKDANGQTSQIFGNNDDQVKSSLDRMESILKTHSNKEAFRTIINSTDGFKVEDTRKYIGQVDTASHKIKDSDAYRNAHAVQQQTNREKNK